MSESALQNLADKDYARRQEVRLTCLHAVLHARGPNYHMLGAIADAADMAEFVLNGTNPAGRPADDPKSDPTAVPSACVVEDEDGTYRQVSENEYRRRETAVAAVDDLVENLKQEHNIRGGTFHHPV